MLLIELFHLIIDSYSHCELLLYAEEVRENSFKMSTFVDHGKINKYKMTEFLFWGQLRKLF